MMGDFFKWQAFRLFWRSAATGRSYNCNFCRCDGSSRSLDEENFIILPSINPPFQSLSAG